MKKLRVAAVQQVWTLPSACVSLNVSCGPEPAWAPTLQEMWRSLISVPSHPVSEMRKGLFQSVLNSICKLLPLSLVRLRQSIEPSIQ